MIDTADQDRMLRRFGWTYPLAILGAHIAFVPFFALLLPRRIITLIGENSVTKLSWVLLVGALVASLTNIAAGYWSDRWLVRHGSRRGILWVGLHLLMGSYIWLAYANSFFSVVGAIIVFQFSLNVFFAPAGALLSDYVPNMNKGRVAGWSNAALPLASVFTATLALAFPEDGTTAYLATALAVVLCALPLLVRWPISLPMQPSSAISDGDAKAAVQRATIDFALAWIARFLIQFGAAIVLGYLFAMLTLQEGIDDFPQSATEAMTELPIYAAIAGFSGALVSGYLSDQAERRLPPIAFSAALVAVSLGLLASDVSWTVFIVSYATFHFGLTGFLAIDSALIAQLLSGNSRRGMWLGLMNLTNTLPAILGPAMTLLAIGSLSQMEALRTVTGLAAIAALIAGVLILRVRTVR